MHTSCSGLLLCHVSPHCLVQCSPGTWGGITQGHRCRSVLISAWARRSTGRCHGPPTRGSPDHGHHNATAVCGQHATQTSGWRALEEERSLGVAHRGERFHAPLPESPSTSSRTSATRRVWSGRRHEPGYSVTHAGRHCRPQLHQLPQHKDSGRCGDRRKHPRSNEHPHHSYTAAAISDRSRYPRYHGVSRGHHRGSPRTRPCWCRCHEHRLPVTHSSPRGAGRQGASEGMARYVRFSAILAGRVLALLWAQLGAALFYAAERATTTTAP